ncbi:MAG: lipoprotein-releasing ABC transporter permease subunit LolE [Alteromonadaceae bacterium]|nr:lipoprotein-releasing ABC transporter permease subunit LolE [Alteromonadaceae bacterium]
MFNSLSLFLGWRYVRSRQQHGFASFISASSTIGIALGVMVLIVALSAMNGFERELSQRLLSIVPHAEIIAVDQPINDWQVSIKQVRKNPSVVAAAPLIKMTGLLQKGSQLKALEIRGVDPDLEEKVSSIATYVIQGSWQALKQGTQSNQASGIIIGAGVAKKLKVSLGDKLQLLLPKQHHKNQRRRQFSAPIKRNVKVVGIFKFGGTIDDTLAYMSLTQAAQAIDLAKVTLANGKSSYQVHGIRLKVNNAFDAPKIARQVASHFNYYVYIYDWTYTQGHLYNDIQLVRMVMFIVLALVIAVASFNIVSTLVMTVNEKKGDIAILITMGAKASTIMRSFMIQGLFNGVLGCFVGAALGIIMAKNLTAMVRFLEDLLHKQFLSGDVYFINFIPSQLEYRDVLVTVVIALVLSLLATLYPAWQATKIQPAEVLGQI